MRALRADAVMLPAPQHVLVVVEAPPKRTEEPMYRVPVIMFLIS